MLIITERLSGGPPTHTVVDCDPSFQLDFIGSSLSDDLGLIVSLGKGHWVVWVVGRELSTCGWCIGCFAVVQWLASVLLLAAAHLEGLWSVAMVSRPQGSPATAPSPWNFH